MKRVVFISGNIPKIGIDLLKSKGYETKVHREDEIISRKKLLKNIKDADALISMLTDKIDREIIDAAPNLKIIANYAAGYNNIDIAYAKEKNIVVTNTPDVLTDATADIAIMLALMASRKAVEAENFMRKKKFKGWLPQLFLGLELKNRTFGIIGAGRIGQATAKRAKAFGANIVYYSRIEKPELEYETEAKRLSLNALLKKSDFISLHLPLTPETFHIINKNNIGFLKKNCVIVNTGRGELIDEKELIKALKLNKIFAAGFDVYEGEPKVNPELLKLQNVVLLPHIGSATQETRAEMAVIAAKNVISVLEGKKPLNPVF